MTVGDTDIVNRCWTHLVAETADETGLAGGLSAAMLSATKRRRGLDRCRVLVDLADGGATISDLAMPWDQPSIFGSVASNPTERRTLDAVG